MSVSRESSPEEAPSSPYKLQRDNTSAPIWSEEVEYRASQDLEMQEDHPEYYLSTLAQSRIKNDASLSEEDKMIIQRLACRKFHIPGKTFWGDYFYWYVERRGLPRVNGDVFRRSTTLLTPDLLYSTQRFSNNHPFLCFFFADPRHPLGKRERTLNLLATLAFGLAATCCVVLWFDNNPNRNFDNVAFPLPFYGDVTVGMLALILFGGPLHVMFDLSLYFVQACPPCRTGGIFDKYLPDAHQKCWLWIGAHVAFLITIASLSLAINVMLVRASIADGDGSSGNISTNLKHYHFVLLYMVEVVVANFVVFPIGTFTMFSGVLGCGVIPGIGGRPYQVRKHQLMLERQAKKVRQSQATI